MLHRNKACVMQQQYQYRYQERVFCNSNININTTRGSFTIQQYQYQYYRRVFYNSNINNDIKEGSFAITISLSIIVEAVLHFPCLHLKTHFTIDAFQKGWCFKKKRVQSTQEIHKQVTNFTNLASQDVISPGMQKPTAISSFVS